VPDDDLVSLPLDQLLEELASARESPAGGSAAAAAVAMSAALVEMVAVRSRDQWADAAGAIAQARSLRARAAPLVQEDAEVYALSLAAMRVGESGEGGARDETIALALGRAADVALAIASVGADTATLAEHVADRGNPAQRDDAHAALLLAEAGTQVAARLVSANLVTAAGDERAREADACLQAAAAARSRIAI
jgi:formiminotetrahydrofolate cyclodeaminase